MMVSLSSIIFLFCSTLGASARFIHPKWTTISEVRLGMCLVSRGEGMQVELCDQVMNCCNVYVGDILEGFQRTVYKVDQCRNLKIQDNKDLYGIVTSIVAPDRRFPWLNKMNDFELEFLHIVLENGAVMGLRFPSYSFHGTTHLMTLEMLGLPEPSRRRSSPKFGLNSLTAWERNIWKDHALDFQLPSLQDPFYDDIYMQRANFIKDLFDNAAQDRHNFFGQDGFDLFDNAGRDWRFNNVFENDEVETPEANIDVDTNEDDLEAHDSDWASFETPEPKEILDESTMKPLDNDQTTESKIREDEYEEEIKDLFNDYPVYDYDDYAGNWGWGFDDESDLNNDEVTTEASIEPENDLEDDDENLEYEEVLEDDLESPESDEILDESMIANDITTEAIIESTSEPNAFQYKLDLEDNEDPEDWNEVAFEALQGIPVNFEDWHFKPLLKAKDENQVHYNIVELD